jgi:hypothetical protein
VYFESTLSAKIFIKQAATIIEDKVCIMLTLPGLVRVSFSAYFAFKGFLVIAYALILM